MRGTIDGIEVYLDDAQLPAFTLSVDSILDPSKVQGVRSTTIRVIATPEAKRVLGSQYMSRLSTGARPKLRIGNGDVDLFRSQVVPVKFTRDVIECLAVGGNAGWFEFAKGLKLRDHDFGLADPSTEVTIQNTWSAGAYAPTYYPLVDYGALEGRDDTYSVTAAQFRPAIGVFHTMERLFAEQGFELWPDQSVVDSLLKLVALTPGDALVRRTQGDPATRVSYEENPSIQYNITEVGTTPNVLTGLDTTTTFGSAQWDAVNFAYIPDSDGRLVLMIANGFCRIYINPAYTSYIGRRIRMLMWDFTDGIEVAGVWSGQLTTLGMIDFGMEIGPKYVIAGHKIGVAFQVDGPVDDVDIEVVPFIATYAPESDWVAGESPYINSLMPAMTLGELLTSTAALLDCVVITTGKRITLKTWDAHIRATTTGTTRDWTSRIDHSEGPARLVSKPFALSFAFTKDNNDREVGRLNRLLGGEGFANARVAIDGTESEVKVSVKASPTAMMEVMGGCLIPIMRKLGGAMDPDEVHYLDNFEGNTRFLMVDGQKEGTWKFGANDKTTYPNCYFLRPDQETLPLHFGNADIFGSAEVPGSVVTSWKRRIDVLRNSDVLEAYFHLRDYELQDFDFGLPTLVDDGSGPAWYWVQEIMGHQFGKGNPTKVQLVKMPTLGSGLSLVAPPPFVCDSLETISIIATDSWHPSVSTDTGFYTIRDQDGVLFTFASGTQQFGFTEGVFCIFPSDGSGIKTGHITDYFIQGNGSGSTNGVIVDVSRMTIIDTMNLRRLDNSSLMLSGIENSEYISLSESPNLPSVDISSNDSAIGVDIENCESLADVTISTLPLCVSFIGTECAFSQSTVDNILVAIAANGLAVGVDLSGGTNAAPSATGLAAKSTIISNGGTVTTN